LYADCSVTETIIWPVILIINCFKHRNKKIYIYSLTLNEQLKTNVAIRSLSKDLYVS